MKRFTALSLSGGAEKGFVQLGVLHHYFETGELRLDHLRSYSGTSIGSVICLLMICGYTPEHIFRKMYGIKDLLRIEVGANSIKDVLDKKGLFPIEYFTDLPKNFIIEKYGHVPTLKELYELTGKEFTIHTSDLTNMRPRTLTRHTDPDLDCISAIGYSCALPGVFHQQYYDSDLLVDGGLTDNFPIQSVYTPHDEILAIVITTTELPNVDPSKIMGYVYRLALLAINANTQIRCEYSADNLTVVQVSWRSESVLALGLPTEEKMRMFLRGIQAAEYHSSINEIYVKDYHSE